MAAVIARASLVGNDPNRNNNPATSCALCGCKDVIVRCDKCDGFAFCFACDDIYHIHPKRKFHIRASIEKPAPVTVPNHHLPKQPLNAKIVGQSPNPAKMPVPPPRRRRSLSVARPAEMAMSIKDKLGNFLRRHSSTAKAEAKAAAAAAKVRSPSLGEQPALFIERPASRVPAAAAPPPEELPKASTLKSLKKEGFTIEPKQQDLRSATFTRATTNGLPPVQSKPVVVPNGEEMFWPRSNGRRASSSSGTKSDLSAVDYVPTMQDENHQRRISQLSSNSSRKFSGGPEFMMMNNKTMPFSHVMQPPPQAQFFGPPLGSPQFGIPYGYNPGWSSSIEELNRHNYQINQARRPEETSTDDDDLALRERRKAQSPRGRSSSRTSRSNSLRRARSQSGFQVPQMAGPWAMMPPLPTAMPPPPPPPLQYMGYMPPYGMNPYGHHNPYGQIVPESSASPRSSASSRRHQPVRAQSQESTGSSKISKYRPSSRNHDHHQRRPERDIRHEKLRTRRSSSRTKQQPQSSGSTCEGSESPDSDTGAEMVRRSENGLNGHQNGVDDLTDARSWTCQYCTYQNPARLDICDMCAKSSPRKIKQEKARELEKLRLDHRLNISEQKPEPVKEKSKQVQQPKKKKPTADEPKCVDMNILSEFPEELIREQLEIEKEMKRRRENELRVARENSELERRNAAQGLI